MLVILFTVWIVLWLIFTILNHREYVRFTSLTTRDIADIYERLSKHRNQIESLDNFMSYSRTVVNDHEEKLNTLSSVINAEKIFQEKEKLTARISECKQKLKELNNNVV